MPRTPTFLEERTTFAGSRSSSAWRAWIQSKKLLMVLSHRVHEGYQGRDQLFTAPSLHCSGCNEPRNTKAPSGAALNLHKNTINPQKNQLLHLTSHPGEMQGSFYNVHTCNPEALVISSVTGLHWFSFSSWLFSVYEIKYWHFFNKKQEDTLTTGILFSQVPAWVPWGPVLAFPGLGAVSAFRQTASQTTILLWSTGVWVMLQWLHMTGCQKLDRVKRKAGISHSSAISAHSKHAHNNKMDRK